MKKQLNIDFVKWLSNKKNEPEFMLEFRIKSYQKFLELENPTFGPKIKFDFNNINYYKSDVDKVTDKWENVNCKIKIVYHKNRTDKDIIFMSTDDALKKYPDIFKKYFNKLISYDENKYTALNGALWSGGSFIYIPPHTKLDRPLQSYFRIESESLGQFERTIIVVDDYSELEYIEGCTAKSYSASALHAGVVEIFVGKHAKCRYSTIQNWSTDVYNLVTKRAIVDDYGKMEWIDGNIGSCVTMKYPSCILKGDNSVGNSLSIAYAKENQALDAGAKMIHIGKNTKSNIVSKSIAENTGISNYRGLVKITENATNSISKVKCDTLILDSISSSNTYPRNIVLNNKSILEHEATISKISEETLFYLMSRGLSEEKATELLVLGFLDRFKEELPMEYAVELNQLLKRHL